MKKHTTWQDCYQVGYSLSGCYLDNYGLNAILILLPGCLVLNSDSADGLTEMSQETARLPIWDLDPTWQLYRLCWYSYKSDRSRRLDYDRTYHYFDCLCIYYIVEPGRQVPIERHGHPRPGGVSKNLVKICGGFSRSDFFSKMESTGCTRLMRKGIWTEKTSKDYQVFFETPPKKGPSSAGKDERQRTFRRSRWPAAVSIHKCRSQSVPICSGV